jgi:NAD(P)-dependent dehydrogenase (short-subunit alcohol dehydrogenase family)
MHVVITGAGRGIGHALAEHYRASGHEVTGTARDGSAEARLDVTDPAQHLNIAEKLSGRVVDLLICNAGVYLDKGQTLDHGYAPAMWADTFATNVTGVFLTIQSLLPHLHLSDRPGIAIISSQMASQSHAPGGSYIYRASKAAVLNLGRNLAADLKNDGIAVGIYHPGWVQTDMGGPMAAITVEDAVNGLVERFETLSLATTGCFETWDGRAHPF